MRHQFGSLITHLRHPLVIGVAGASVVALGLHTVYAVPIAAEGVSPAILYLDARRVIAHDGRTLPLLARVATLLAALL